MKTYPLAAIAVAILTITTVAPAANARSRNELNGTWTLVPAKSDFAGQSVLQTGTVTIHERQGILTVSRKFVYTGATETYFYSDMTDANDNATIRTGKDLKSKTQWEHDTLKVTTTEAGVATIERYALAADGSMLVTVLKPERKPQTLVFRKE